MNNNITSIINDLNRKNGVFQKHTPSNEQIFDHKADHSYPLHSMKVHKVREGSHVVAGTSMENLFLRYDIPRVGLVSYMLLVLKLNTVANFTASFDVFNIIREARIVADNNLIVYSERPSVMCKTITDMGQEFSKNARELTVDANNNTLNIPFIFKNFNDKVENAVNTLAILGKLHLEVECKNGVECNVLEAMTAHTLYEDSHLLIDFCSPLKLSQNMDTQTRHLLMHYREEQKIINKATIAKKISSEQVLKNRGVCKEILVHFYQNTGAKCQWIDPTNITMKLTVKGETVFEFDNSIKQVYNFFDRTHIHSNSENIYYSSTATSNRPYVIQFGVNSHVNNAITSGLSLNCSSKERLWNAQDGDAILTVKATFENEVPECNMEVITSMYGTTVFHSNGIVESGEYEDAWLQGKSDDANPSVQASNDTEMDDVVDRAKERETINAPHSEARKPGVVENIRLVKKSGNGEKLPRFEKEVSNKTTDDAKSKNIKQGKYTNVGMTG